MNIIFGNNCWIDLDDVPHYVIKKLGISHIEWLISQEDARKKIIQRINTSGATAQHYAHLYHALKGKSHA